MTPENDGPPVVYRLKRLKAVGYLPDYETLDPEALWLEHVSWKRSNKTLTLYLHGRGFIGPPSYRRRGQGWVWAVHQKHARSDFLGAGRVVPGEGAPLFGSRGCPPRLLDSGRLQERRIGWR